MKVNQSPKERGQALIMIAFAAVALFAITALVIDGGMVFSDRRHSQNASDTAVLAAALSKIREETWTTVALARALDNGYDDAAAETQVIVRRCDDTTITHTEDGRELVCEGLPAGANESEYIQVHIKSVVHLTFARIIGRETITNHTNAIARATESVPTPWFDGYGIASLHEGCKDPGEGEPFELGGSAFTVVDGAGVLINASCPSQASFVQNGTASSLETTTGVCVHGSANYQPGDVTPSVQTGCEPIDPDKYKMPPAPDCPLEGEIIDMGNYYLAKPGYYDDTFPDVSGGQTTIKITKGVYCLRDGLDVGAGWNLTTDLNGNGGHDGATEGVFFYIEGGNFKLGGGGNITLHAINNNTLAGFQNAWLNMLMYIPSSNEADIDISGNSGSMITGTILAPSSHVHLLGSNSTDAGTFQLDSQIISDTVKISGNTSFELTYDESNNSVTVTNPDIELIE